jgi:hypothetical protein
MRTTRNARITGVALLAIVIVGVICSCVSPHQYPDSFVDQKQTRQLLQIMLNRIAASRGGIVSEKSVEVMNYTFNNKWHIWSVKACFLQPPQSTGICSVLEFRVLEDQTTTPLQWTIVFDKPDKVVQKVVPSENMLIINGINAP